MLTKDFLYSLPDNLIAQYPANERGESRMLVLDEVRKISDKKFKDIIGYLTSDDLIVLNDTRVIPARLFLLSNTPTIPNPFLLIMIKTSAMGVSKTVRGKEFFVCITSFARESCMPRLPPG